MFCTFSFAVHSHVVIDYSSGLEWVLIFSWLGIELRKPDYIIAAVRQSFWH